MKTTALIVALSLGASGISLVSTASAQGQLTGSGDHLIIPNQNPGNPNQQFWTISNQNGDVSFDGSWSNPAFPDWIGTFSGTGPVPAGSGGTGTARMDFTTLATGVLPSDTFFNLSDLDTGSGSESFTLWAFQADGQPITSAWLNTMTGVGGTGSGSGGVPALLDMPSWNFDSNSGVYTFDGNSQAGNPNTFITLTSNKPIGFLEVYRSSAAAHMRLGAPVPAPGAVILGAIAVPLLARRRR